MKCAGVDLKIENRRRRGGGFVGRHSRRVLELFFRTPSLYSIPLILHKELVVLLARGRQDARSRNLVRDSLPFGDM